MPDNINFVTEFNSLMEPRFDAEKLRVTGVVLFAPKPDGDFFVSENGNHYAESFFQSVVENAAGALGFPRHPKGASAGKIEEERDAGDAIYTVENPRLVVENGQKKVLGDLQFFDEAKKHFNVMKKGHKRLGLSICAPTINRKDYTTGNVITEKIDADHNFRLTVDFGEMPSATRSVFEFGPKPPENQPKENSMDTEMQKTLDAALAAQKIAITAEFGNELAKRDAEVKTLARKALVAEKLAGRDTALITESLIHSLTGCPETAIDGIVKQHFDILGRLKNPVNGAGGTGGTQMVAEKTQSLDIRVEIGATRGIHGLVAEMGAGEQGESRQKAQAARFVAEFGWIGDARFTGGKWTALRAEMLKGWSPRGLTQAILGTTEKGIVAETAILSTSFQTINNLLLAATVIARYEILECTKFVDQLFPKYASTKELETWPGYQAVSSTLAVVPENTEYPDATLSEKYAQDVRFGKYGAKVLISEEELLFDQPGQVMMRANRITDTYALLRARQIVKALYDVDASWYCYRPAGSRAALWGTTNTLSSNPLTDYTSTWPIRKKLRGQVDENGDRIDQSLTPIVLVLPTALEEKAEYLANATMIRNSANSMAVGQYGTIPDRIRIQPIYSTLLDDYNTATYGSADEVYFASGPNGFADQFLIKSHFPFGAEAIPPAEIGRVIKDVIGGVRVRYKERLFAIDNKRVVKVHASAMTT